MALSAVSICCHVTLSCPNNISCPNTPYSLGVTSHHTVVASVWHIFSHFSSNLNHVFINYNNLLCVLTVELQASSVIKITSIHICGTPLCTLTFLCALVICNILGCFMYALWFLHNLGVICCIVLFFCWCCFQLCSFQLWS